MSDQSLPREFEPKVVAYCCTYCAYTAGDLAGSMRLEYAPNVRIVKILCAWPGCFARFTVAPNR